MDELNLNDDDAMIEAEIAREQAAAAQARSVADPEPETGAEVGAEDSARGAKGKKLRLPGLKMSRSTRIGVASVLSFSVLTGGLATQKFWKKTNPEASAAASPAKDRNAHPAPEPEPGEPEPTTAPSAPAPAILAADDGAEPQGDGGDEFAPGSGPEPAASPPALAAEADAMPPLPTTDAPVTLVANTPPPSSAPSPDEPAQPAPAEPAPPPIGVADAPPPPPIASEPSPSDLPPFVPGMAAAAAGAAAATDPASPPPPSIDMPPNPGLDPAAAPPVLANTPSPADLPPPLPTADPAAPPPSAPPVVAATPAPEPAPAPPTIPNLSPLPETAGSGSGVAVAAVGATGAALGGLAAASSGGDDGTLKPLPNAGRTMTPLEQPLGPTPTPVDTVQVPARPMTKSMTPESAPAERAVAFAPGSIQHVVQAGENFWTISRLYYGKGRYYKALWKANQDRVPAIDKLYVGMSVRVPPPESLDASLVEPARDAPTATASKPASRPRPAPTRAADGSTLVMLPIGESTARSSSSSRSSEPLEPRSSRPIHVVRDRETLRSIARDTLGDARRADEIENLNRDVIVDVSALEPGMRLRLPADARVRR